MHRRRKIACIDKAYLLAITILQYGPWIQAETTQQHVTLQMVSISRFTVPFSQPTAEAKQIIEKQKVTFTHSRSHHQTQLAGFTPVQIHDQDGQENRVNLVTSLILSSSVKIKILLKALQTLKNALHKCSGTLHCIHICSIT